MGHSQTGKAPRALLWVRLPSLGDGSPWIQQGIIQSDFNVRTNAVTPRGGWGGRVEAGGREERHGQDPRDRSEVGSEEWRREQGGKEPKEKAGSVPRTGRPAAGRGREGAQSGVGSRFSTWHHSVEPRTRGDPGDHRPGQRERGLGRVGCRPWKSPRRARNSGKEDQGQSWGDIKIFG